MINRLAAYLGRHVDSYLLAALSALLVVGLLTLYSASGESFARAAIRFLKASGGQPSSSPQNNNWKQASSSYHGNKS